MRSLLVLGPRLSFFSIIVVVVNHVYNGLEKYIATLVRLQYVCHISTLNAFEVYISLSSSTLNT